MIKDLKNIYIFSGLPGSGKSYNASFLKKTFKPIAHVEIFSTDDFFINSETGKYEYKPEKQSEAHKVTFRKYIEYVRDNCDAENIIVYVDNTNLTAAEIAPYYQVGQAYGWPVKIITIKYPPEKAFERQTHGIPLEVFMHMFANFRDRKLPSYWDSEEIDDDGEENIK